jgi:hypothetical protein
MSNFTISKRLKRRGILIYLYCNNYMTSHSEKETYVFPVLVLLCFFVLVIVSNLLLQFFCHIYISLFGAEVGTNKISLINYRWKQNPFIRF